MQIILVITPTGTNYEVSSSALTLTVLIELTAPAVNVSDYCLGSASGLP